MTQHKDRKQAIRARMAETGEPYTVAARALDIRAATATATYEPGRGWRLMIAETARYGGRPISWPVGCPWNDRTIVVKQMAPDLEVYGWDAVRWPDADPVPASFTVPLARNERGHRLDEVDQLHRAAGVTYHTAHHAYIEAVADMVRGTGIPIGDIEGDADEPRGGSFRIGGDLEDFWDDDTGYGPSTCIMWREGRGWYEVGFSDSQQALGDYAQDLPGGLGLVALPHHVAGAVRQVVPAAWLPDGWVPADLVPWTPPAGYDPDPPMPEDGWDVSPALERSLVAYVRAAAGQ